MVHKMRVRNTRELFGLSNSLHQFKLQCLNGIVKEVIRLRTKHILNEWSHTQTAKDLVLTLDEYIDVNSLMAHGNYE